CVFLDIVFTFFFFQAEDGIRDFHVTGVQTCALPIYDALGHRTHHRVAAPASPTPRPLRAHRRDPSGLPLAGLHPHLLQQTQTAIVLGVLKHELVHLHDRCRYNDEWMEAKWEEIGDPPYGTQCSQTV